MRVEARNNRKVVNVIKLNVAFVDVRKEKSKIRFSKFLLKTD